MKYCKECNAKMEGLDEHCKVCGSKYVFTRINEYDQSKKMIILSVFSGIALILTFIRFNPIYPFIGVILGFNIKYIGYTKLGNILIIIFGIILVLLLILLLIGLNYLDNPGLN